MKKILSLFVFFAISSLVVYGAGFTLDKCLTEQSNFEIIASLLKSGTVPAIAQLPSESSVLGVAEVAPTPTPNQNSVIEKLRSCQSKQASGNSIINYYMTNNLDYSFESRVQDAEVYGITNYRGTADQNIQLLQLQIQKQIEKCLNFE